MADENYKLAKFQAAVFAEIDMKAAQIKQDAEVLKEKELEHNKDVQLEKSYNYIQKKSADIKKHYKREVARFTLEKNRELLIKRNEIKERVFENVAVMLANYTKTPEYKAYLITAFDKFAKANVISSAVIEVRPDDMKFKDDIAPLINGKCEFHESSKIKLGGFILRDLQGGVYFDETLESKLSDQESYFMQHSQLSF